MSVFLKNATFFEFYSRVELNNWGRFRDRLSRSYLWGFWFRGWLACLVHNYLGYWQFYHGVVANARPEPTGKKGHRYNNGIHGGAYYAQGCLLST